MTVLPQASHVLFDAHFVDLDGENQGADAIAFSGGRVLAVGRAEDLSPLIGPRTTLESLGGRSLLPAFTDAHLHLELYARSLDQVDCETHTVEECVERLRRRAATIPPGKWILGHGWNQNEWGRPPATDLLNQAVPHHPVYATAKSLHAAWANASALRLAQTNADTPDPDGGKLLRDSTGAPNGILLESACSLVSRQVPAPDLNELCVLVGHAQESLWRRGIACVHDFDGPRLLQTVQRLRHSGGLGLRILKSIPRERLPEAIGLGVSAGLGDHWIRLGHVKLFADGALGSRTAAMLSAYDGEPDNQGVLLLDEETIVEIGRQAATAGLSLAVHAIGDRSTHAVICALHVLQQELSGWPQLLPHRIEHLQLLHPQDLARLAELHCVASMQPIHATSDMLMADRYWGDRTRYAYGWKIALRAGMTLAFGSDAPVEDPDPLLGLRAAIARRRSDGSPGPSGWVPEEKLSLREALRAYTLGPAHASGSAHEQGALRPGYLGDLVVLNADPLALSPEELREVRVVGTMVDAVWRFRDF